MTPSDSRLFAAAIAAHRFGLGEPTLAPLADDPRGWLLAQIKPWRIERQADLSNGVVTTNADGEPELIRWYARESHTEFDVCADDHCPARFHRRRDGHIRNPLGPDAGHQRVELREVDVALEPVLARRVVRGVDDHVDEGRPREVPKP